jgi:N6-L-threonylcarbamoyladenine synthase
VAASFQAAVTDVLVQKAIHALEKTGLKTVVLAGGVSANKELQQKLDGAAAKAMGAHSGASLRRSCVQIMQS